MRYLFRLTAALLLIAASPVRAADLVVLLTPQSVPFSYLDERGELTGFNVDIARALCREMGRNCRLETARFPEIIPSIVSGGADIGVANFLRTPERERQVAFSAPYWRSTSAFVGPLGIKPGDVGQMLAEHTVCAINGSRQHAYLQARAGNQAAQVKALDSNQAVLDGLRDRQCGLALLPTMQALPFLQSEAGRGMGYLGAPLEAEGLSGTVHLVVRQGDPALLKRVDQAIQTLIRSGEHERTARKYFPFSIL